MGRGKRRRSRSRLELTARPSKTRAVRRGTKGGGKERVTLSNLNTRTGLKKQRGHARPGADAGGRGNTAKRTGCKPRHWICYHNPDTMGFPAGLAEARGRVMTRKRLRTEDLLGDRVWVVSRSRRGRYFLEEHFRVGSTERGEEGELVIVGEARTVRPRRWLDGLQWFERYRTEMNGLSLGLQSVKDLEIIRGLQGLAEAAEPAPGTTN